MPKSEPGFTGASARHGRAIELPREVFYLVLISRCPAGVGMIDSLWFRCDSTRSCGSVQSYLASTLMNKDLRILLYHRCCLRSRACASFPDRTFLLCVLFLSSPRRKHFNANLEAIFSLSSLRPSQQRQNPTRAQNGFSSRSRRFHRRRLHRCRHQGCTSVRQHRTVSSRPCQNRKQGGL